MGTKNIDGLSERNDNAKENAATLIELKIDALEAILNERLAGDLPVGDLPKNILAFTEWVLLDIPDCVSSIPSWRLSECTPKRFLALTNWPLKTILKTNRATLDQPHNKHHKNNLQEILKRIKVRPISNSEADIYKQKIKVLEEQLSGLADENLRLNSEIRNNLLNKRDEIASKDQEIKRLKALLKVNSISNVRSL